MAVHVNNDNIIEYTLAEYCKYCYFKSGYFMKKLFETHCHCHLYDLPIDEETKIFDEEFKIANIAKCCFLSIPEHIDGKGGSDFDILHNLRILFYKKHFSPNGYAFAGLEHPKTYSNLEELNDVFFNQVKKCFDMGFDGMKMIEGYPTFIKYKKLGLDSIVYDKFFSFCETNNFPITIHIANPDENWDYEKASKEAIELGRVYDDSFPTKEEITSQLFNVLDKYPKLTLTVAHFGFFTNHMGDAIKFMSYPNTYLDTTPGGEQFINMSKNWSLWSEFFNKYQDRIIYGSDFYPFKKDEYWMIAFLRRPNFLRQFFESDEEHLYLNEKFKGIKIDSEILDKIYMKNAINLFSTPKELNIDLIKKEIENISSLLTEEKDKYNLKKIKELFC